MKALNILLSIALVAMTASFAVATTHHKKHHKTSTVSAKSMYVCPECKMASSKPGKDAMGHDMVKAKVDYECASCGTHSSKAGKCAKCGAEMAKTATYYACDECKTSSDHAGKCTKCGKEMEKKTVELKDKM